MGNLTKLVIGSLLPPCDLSEAIESIRLGLTPLERECIAFATGRASKTKSALYGPYAARTLLELSLTGLIARIDPFRILYLKRHQESDHYSVSDRNRSAIQWHGDIASREKAPEKLWAADPERTNCRALFSDWNSSISWEVAHETLSDHPKNGVTSPWLDALLAIDPKAITTKMRQDADRLFSTLSKGVHPEFAVNRSSLFDKLNIAELSTKSLCLAAQVSLLTNFIPHAHGVLRAESALSLFNQIERQANGHQSTIH